MKTFKRFIILLFAVGLTGCAFGEKTSGQNNIQKTKHHGQYVINKKKKKTYALNINKASMKQLMTIKGINKKRAQNLIAYRKKHGDFKFISDLKNVEGFNKKILKKIKHHVTV